MAGTLDLIRDWATELPYWEKIALEKVASGIALEDEDYENLFELFLQHAGLLPEPTDERPKLTFPIKMDDWTAPGYKIESLFNLQNVNALPPGQELSFGGQLTAVYGPNAAGKTGYSRPLACAGFARGEHEVLTDARKARPASPPKAEFAVSKAGIRKTVTWEYGTRCRELAGLYVFDGNSIAAHLTRANSISFAPAGLSLLTELVDVTDAVRGRARKFIDDLQTPHNLGQFFVGDTPVSLALANLCANSNKEALEGLAQMSSADEDRMAKLDREIFELKSRSVPQRIESLQQEVGDLETLLTNVESSTSALGPESAAAVSKLIGNFHEFQNEASRVGADQFRFAQFTQIGTDVWRRFLQSAKALADTEGARGSGYPQENDACLLCRQPLNPEARDLISRMWTFLSSDAQSKFDQAKEACRAHGESLMRLSLSYFGADSPARRIMQVEAPEAVAELDAFITECSLRKQELFESLSTASLRKIGPRLEARTGPVQLAISRRKEQIGELEKMDVALEVKRRQGELLGLQHRQTLGEKLPALNLWIGQQNWAAQAQQAIGSSRHITDKYDELFKLLVTDQYKEVFQSMLKKLKRHLRLTVETRGRKGETVRQIVLSSDAFVQKVSVESVLSDGEKRAVALVDFLTEASLDGSINAILLDDPVSSFDLDSKAAVAELLSEFAAKHQVIVFTHDLAFLHALKECAKKLKVEILSHWVRPESGQPGYVYLNNSPLCEGDYKSAQFARDYYAQAKKAGPQEQEQLLQQGFGALRTTYEAFVIYGLFGGVVERFEERIGFDKLKSVVFDQGVVNKVAEKLGTLSRYIDAHLHSDAFAAEKPTPEMLLAEIEEFEQVKGTHKAQRSREATTQKGLKGAS